MNSRIFEISGERNLRVALVHFWCVRRGGAERVLEVLADMFPQADIFMILYDSAALPDSLKSRRVTSSFLHKFPGSKRYHRALLPFFPLALEQINLDDYDLVISHESGPAKGVLTRASTCHICYCHTPMRYVWDMYHEYRSSAPLGALGRAYYSLAAHYVRQWDYAAAGRVDHFIASSTNGANRIRKCYGRIADVVHPPVDIQSFTLSTAHEDFYLVVSRLVKYKRIDLAIRACNELKRRLIVIGDAEEGPALRQIAGPTVTFLGRQPDHIIRDYYRRCRAFLFPGEEDIGIAPIEAQASGRPVIAFGRGGALETVVGYRPRNDVPADSYTGVFFQEQTVESLVEAMLAFERMESQFSPPSIRSHATRFDTFHFRRAMTSFIEEKLKEYGSPSLDEEIEAVRS